MIDARQMLVRFQEAGRDLWRRPPVQFAWFVAKRLDHFRIGQVAGSLTYTTLLALVPLLTVSLILLPAFQMFGDLATRFNELITSVLMPEMSAKVIGGYMFTFTQNAGKLTAIGVVALAVSAFLLIMTIERTFNHIWNVNDSRPLWTRLLVYWALLTLGPLAIGLAMNGWNLLFRNTTLAIFHPGLADALHSGLTVLFGTAVLWVFYRLVPYRYVPPLQALVGALVTALLLELTRRGFGLYFGRFNSYELIYGAFSAVPLFLLWMYCQWYVLVGGAVFTASLSYWEGGAFMRKVTARGLFDDVLKILLLLYQAQSQGRAMKTQDFRPFISMGYDELGGLLDKMQRMGYITRGEDGVVLKTGAEHINLRALFQTFVYTPSHQSDVTSQVIDTLMQPSLASLNLTLAEFVARMEAADTAAEVPRASINARAYSKANSTHTGA